MNEYLPPSEYLPHAEPMMLLDEVVNVTENDVHCQVSVHLGGVLGPFLDAQGNLPGWFALELMAQTWGFGPAGIAAKRGCMKFHWAWCLAPAS